MRYFIAFLLAFASDMALADALDSWTTWATAQPYVSKQVPPAALVARGIGTDAYYVLEVDETTGEIPLGKSLFRSQARPSQSTTLVQSARRHPLTVLSSPEQTAPTFAGSRQIPTANS
jgi:hypothetical protein